MSLKTLDFSPSSFSEAYKIFCIEKKYKTVLTPPDREKIFKSLEIKININPKNFSFDTIIQIIKNLDEKTLERLWKKLWLYIHGSKNKSPKKIEEFTLEKILVDLETLKYWEKWNYNIEGIKPKVRRILKKWLTLKNSLDPSLYQQLSETEIKKIVLEFFIFARAIYKKYGYILFPQFVEILTIFKSNLASPKPKIIWFVGETGLGKTELAIFLSKFFFKKKPIIFSPSKQTSKKEIESIIVKWMKEWRPVIIDEINLIDQNTLISLNPIFDAFSTGRKVIINGEEVEPQKWFFIFFTRNTYSYERNELDESIRDRILIININQILHKVTLINKYFNKRPNSSFLFFIARSIATNWTFGINYWNKILTPLPTQPNIEPTPLSIGNFLIWEEKNLRDIISLLYFFLGQKRHLNEIQQFIKKNGEKEWNLDINNGLSILKIVTGFNRKQWEEIYKILSEHSKNKSEIDLKIDELNNILYEFESFIQKITTKVILKIQEKYFKILEIYWIILPSRENYKKIC